MIPLAGRIAWKYLFGRKSHSAVNAIALVSLCGIAVATAAIICVLSVFNGFQSVLGDKLDSFTPDMEVCEIHGKVFSDGDSLANALGRLPEVAIAQPVLTQQALALFASRELPVILRGVIPDKYNKATRFDTLFYDGSEPLVSPRFPQQAAPASLAIGTAVQLQVGRVGEKVTIFAPRRQGRINLANPAASFLTDSIEITSIYQSGQKEFDDNIIITDIDRVRKLLQHPAGSASRIEVKLKAGVSPEDGLNAITKVIGTRFRVKDRMSLHEVSFRMVKIEKYITFLLLVFILIIASFNVVSTLCMLVIEKEDSIKTLESMGMTRGRISGIFAWESWLVTLAGGVAGLALGSLLCLLQQHFGFIKLNADPETLLMSTYPVRLELRDLLLTMLPVIVIGGACAMTASRFTRRRMKP